MSEYNEETIISLVSLGCDKNLVESELLLGALSEGEGYAFSFDEAMADAIIINTCGFIKDAVDEGTERIREALELKASGRCKWVIVTGCMAQRYKDGLLADFPGIDALEQTPADVAAALARLSGKAAPKTGKPRRVLSTPGHYAYLKIAEGCDNRCAYCAIPMIKGRYISRPMEDIIEEAETLAQGGVKELVIVAQDTALYGEDIYGEKQLHVLLRRLSEIPGVAWLRLMYCYPEHITEELIDEMADNPKVCRYLDVPVQHAAKGVLARMGRKTDGEGLKALMARLRERIPGIILRTTVMVGFPGETREDFQMLIDFITEVQFDRLGAFAYSREEGTPAARLPEQIPEGTKKSRYNTVMKRQNAISAAKLLGLAGATLTALVDGYDSEGKVFFGRSYMDCPETDGLVFIENAPKGLKTGDFVTVRVTEALEYDLVGQVVPNGG